MKPSLTKSLLWFRCYPVSKRIALSIQSLNAHSKSSLKPHLKMKNKKRVRAFRDLFAKNIRFRHVAKTTTFDFLPARKKHASFVRPYRVHWAIPQHERRRLPFLAPLSCGEEEEFRKSETTQTSPSVVRTRGKRAHRQPAQQDAAWKKTLLLETGRCLKSD